MHHLLRYCRSQLLIYLDSIQMNTQSIIIITQVSQLNPINHQANCNFLHLHHHLLLLVVYSYKASHSCKLKVILAITIS